MTLLEFVEARLRELEDGLDWHDSCGRSVSTEYATPYRGVEFGRADLAAKRQLLALHSVRSGTGGDWDTDPPAMCTECVYELHPCQTLRLLAAPFSPHPDYDPAWRPS